MHVHVVHGSQIADNSSPALHQVANLLLDPGLMIWPVRWGVTGAAAATAASQVVACGLLLRALRAQLFCGPAAAAAAAPAAAPAAAASRGSGEHEEEAEEEAAARRRLAGTSAATLTRTSSVLGCWVFIASMVARRLGPSAIAAHGVALKASCLPPPRLLTRSPVRRFPPPSLSATYTPFQAWLLLVLAAEAYAAP